MCVIVVQDNVKFTMLTGYVNKFNLVRFDFCLEKDQIPLWFLIIAHFEHQ